MNLARPLVRRLAMIAALGALASSASACSAPEDDETSVDDSELGSGSFTNPVIPMYDRPPGVGVDVPRNTPHEKTEGCPDPSALRTRAGDYFIYCTSYTFPYGRLNGFPIFESESRSLAGPWKPVGAIIADKNDSRAAWPRWVRDRDGKRDGSFWGPDVQELPSGKFVASYSAPCGDARWGNRRCVGIAWADEPTGPWTHRQSAFVDPTNNGAAGGDSYDPNLLVTSKGELYFYWVVTGVGVFVRRVAAKASGELGWFDGGAKPVLIASKAKGQRGEGPYVVEHAGAFYETYSTGSLFFGYHVGVRRGERPDAPFVVEGPASVVEPSAHFVATGGNSLVRDGAGRTYLVYHAIVVPKGGGCPRQNPVWGGAVKKEEGNPHCRVEGDRQAMIDPVVWKRAADGFDWPVLKNGKGTPSTGSTSLR